MVDIAQPGVNPVIFWAREVMVRVALTLHESSRRPPAALAKHMGPLMVDSGRCLGIVRVLALIDFGLNHINGVIQRVPPRGQTAQH